MKPTVFLDMDGVLTFYLEMFFSKQAAEVDHEVDKNHIDVNKGRMLGNFIIDNDLQVVLSSDWRKRSEYDAEPKKFEDYFFQVTGCRIPVVGMTSVLGHRGMEIQQYISRHEIENYVILDDSDEMLPEQLNRFVHVNHLNGLTMADLVIASNMLKLNNQLSEMIKWIKWHQAYSYYRPTSC